MSVKSKKLIETSDLQFLWNLFKKNIGIIVIMPIVFYGIGYVYAYRLNNVYGSHAQLILKSNDTYDYQDPIYKGLGGYGMYMDVRNQIRILQSRDLILEVVEKMNVEVSYFVVGRLKRKEVFGTLPFNAKADIFDPGVVCENPIEVKVLDENSYQLNYEVNGVGKKRNGQFGEELVEDNFRIILTKNYEFKNDKIQTVLDSDYQLVFHSEDYLVNHFQSRMTIENIEHTSILQINVTDDIEARAKVFLDTLCSVFIDYSKRSQLEVNSNTLKNIEKQIQEVQKILISIENELLAYKSANDIINLPKEEEAYFENYLTYSGVARTLGDQMLSVNLLEDYILNSNDEHLLPPSFYVLEGDEFLKLKVTEFYTKQLEIIETGYNVTESNPRIVNLKKELSEMRRDLLIYLKNLRHGLQAKIDENEIEIKKFKSDVQGIPRSIQGVDNIKRELEVNNKMYLFLLEKKTNTLIARAGIIPQVQVVESPSSSGVIGPDKAKIKNLLFLAGIILGLVIALIRNLFFAKIENVKELEDVTSVPVVAGIPFVKDLDNPIMVNHKPKSGVAESFRVLRTNIAFYGTGNKSKKIVVSSFFPGEGKTFCSSNLAAILANSGKKVLLVDLDLHKPRVHKIHDLENNAGISSYLAGKNDLNVIVNSGISENLDIITSGPIPPNPSELIVAQKFNEFEKYALENYDYLIIDTPPFGLLNDAMDVAHETDLFLAVTNAKIARKRGIQLIEKMISKNPDISYAFVLNGIKQSRFSYYYNKYSYSYAYSYGYGYGYGSEYGSGYGDEEID